MNAQRPTLRRNVRAMPAQAWILFGGTFINRFGSFVVVYLVLYLTERGFSAAQAGLAASAYGAGSFVAAASGGLLADRLGRRGSIVLSMFGSAAAALALSRATDLAVIILLTVALGLAAEAYRPAASALLADLVPAERRLTAFALYRLAVNAGFAVGPVVAGLLAERSFFLLFLGDAVTSAAFGVLALVALPQGRRSSRQDEERGEALRTILRDRAFLLFLFASVASALVYFQSSIAFALHVRAQGFSETVYGVLISVNGLLIVVVELAVITVTQRLPARPVMAVGNLLVGLGFALTGVATSVPPLVLTVIVWTMGEIISAPVASAYVAELAPAHLRGRYNGTWGLTFGLAYMVAPALGAWAFARNPAALWIGCGVLGAVAAALILASPERRVRPTVSRPEPGPEVAGIET